MKIQLEGHNAVSNQPRRYAALLPYMVNSGHIIEHFNHLSVLYLV